MSDTDDDPIDYDKRQEAREAHGDWLRDELRDRKWERERNEGKANTTPPGWNHVGPEHQETRKALGSPIPDVKPMGAVTISRNGYIEELERQLAELKSEYAADRKGWENANTAACEELAAERALADRLADAVACLTAETSQGYDHIQSAFNAWKEARKQP